MKKFIVFIILLFVLITNYLYSQNKFSLKNYFPNGQITTYSHTALNDSTALINNIYISHNRNDDIIGESVFLINYEVGYILQELDANVLTVEHLSERGLTILFCYTPKIHKTVQHKNLNINLQIASCEDYVVVGWPMILGSF